MTGLDTNILIRFVMNDEPAQANAACALLQSFSSHAPGYITLVCAVEFVWVLRSRYRQPKATIVEWMGRFLESSELLFENQDAVGEALERYRAGSAGFSDYLLEGSARAAGCGQTFTFDRRAASSAGMDLLPA